jgi:hypothetical protein
MGIKQLFQIVKEEAPDAIKEGEIKNQFGRKVAIVRLPDLPSRGRASISLNVWRLGEGGGRHR